MFTDCTNLVGGAGTAYDENHTDHTYARIDGGPNSETPGYFTDKNAAEVVAAPTFRFEGDSLFIETATKDASIFYQMADLPNMDDATVQKISESLTVTVDAQQSIYYEQPIELKKSVVLKAIAAGVAVSEVSTLVYDYDAWQDLLKAIDYGMDVSGRASSNSNVPDDMKEQLSHMLEEGKWVYYERMWESNAVYSLSSEIMQLAHQMDEMMTVVVEPEPYAVLSDNNTVLTFYYDKQKSVRGGIEINNSEITSGGDSPYGTAQMAIFDESFANYRPVSTAYWFMYCTWLGTISGIENLKTDSVTNMHSMFFDCYKLTNLDVSGFNTAKVTDMGAMFLGCRYLTNLDLSSFNTDNVTDMSQMFRECSGLSAINLSSFNTDKVTNMENMFYNCSSLTSLDVSGFKTDNVTDMNCMFQACSKVTTLDLSGFKTDKVTRMRRMFQGDTELAKIYVGSDWTAMSVTDGYLMFAGCTNLVGGAGTVYDENHTDHAYAHIDGGPSNPGYFTDKNAPVVVETVATPTFRFDGFDYMAIESGTQDAEIYYTMTRRMLATEETDFGNGYLSSNGGWKTWGDNMSSGDVAYGGYNDSRCLKLVSKENGAFESAQAGYTFSNALTKDDYYMLYFKARSASGRGQLQVYCQNDTVAGTRSAADTLTIGSELADYEVMVKIDNTNTNQFVLNFGAVADTYYIDNVQFGPVISDTTNQLRTRYEQPIELREGVNIKAVAMKEGMQESAPAYYDYFYDGWRMLLEMWEWGMKTFSDAYGDPNVPLQFVEESRMKSEDLFQYMLDCRDNEHVDDTELLEIIDYITRMAYEVEEMRRGFTIDGVSYHAVDSTQVEVIASLDYYSPYRNAVTIAKEVHYNDIDFQVTSVAQGAFANSELGAIIWNPTVALKYEDVAVINNPNLLVYVNDAQYAPENIQNVVVGDYAKTIVLTDVVEGNGNFYCPKEFKAEMISYTRNFLQQTEIGVSRGWESIALPFTVKTIMHEKNGVIAPFGNDASNKHFWLRTLSENGLAQATQIEANTPYIISMPNNDEYSAGFNQAGLVTFSSQDAIVPITEVHAVETSTADGEMIVLLPNFQRVSKDARTYALNVGEQRDGYPEGSVFEANYRDIRPFEAYTIHEGGQGPAPQYLPIADMNGGATGIETLTPSPSPKGEGSYYSLDGRKLQQKPTRKGVYIQNGRRVVIK